MTTAPAFCPHCGTRRLTDARFCVGCGVDLGGAAPVPSGQVTSIPGVASEPTLAPGDGPARDSDRPVAQESPPPVVPALPVSAPPPLPAPARHRSRTPVVLAAALVLVLLLAGGAGLWWLLRPPAGPAATPDGSPFPSPIALTSPPASHAPAIGDPDTPLYVDGQGFSPDAIRVLTVTALSLSLERYRADVGEYPVNLVSLFPAYAPPGPDGLPMTFPLSPPDAYVYARAGSTYTLSVVLATGDTYTVTSP